MKSRILVLLLVLLFATPAAADTRTILVMGDSLSASYGIPDEAGWVNGLRDRLKEVGADTEVINASISGETTRGARGRLPALLERHKPQVVILQLGGNDGLRGIAPQASRDNLVTMAEAAQQAGARVLLVGVRLPPNYGSAFRERFEQLYREVAEQTGASLLPQMLAGVAEKPELIQSDGIHPTTEAQPIILDNVWAKLKPMLLPAKAEKK